MPKNTTQCPRPGPEPGQLDPESNTRNLAVPRSIVNWIIDFLSNRFQRRLLLQVGPVPSGIPQVYQIGPWLFVLIINDLDVNTPHLRKFVDDTTVSEVVPKGITNEAQSIVNQVIEWSHVNRVQLNPDKCKELQISFAPSLLNWMQLLSIQKK